jgi:hypothetical protein
MRTLIVNNANVSSDNATYTYKFPLGAQPEFKKGDQIALSTLSMYYSWPSITSTIGNNSFTYKWVDGTTNTVTLPDGYYTVADLNAYLQYTFVNNKHYLTTSTGDYVYFLQLSANTTRYAVQIDYSPVPTAAEVANVSLSCYGWALPSGAGWALPGSTTYAQITILSNGFRNIIGYNAQSIPTSTTAGGGFADGTKSVISDFTPQVTPVSTVVVTCSLVHNTASIPDTLLYSFSPNVSYGSLVYLQPAYPSFIDIQDGKVSEFSITFLDQSYNRLNIKDNNVVIMLSWRSKGEISS